MSAVIHMPTDSRALELMHLGLMPDGRVVAVTSRNPLPVVIEEGNGARAWEIRQCMGQPFERLPGNRPSHSIVGTLSDGWKVSAAAAELVYNDAALIDRFCGTGYYEKRMARRREAEVLELAKHLYKGPMVSTS